MCPRKSEKKYFRPVKDREYGESPINGICDIDIFAFVGRDSFQFLTLKMSYTMRLRAYAKSANLPKYFNFFKFEQKSRKIMLKLQKFSIYKLQIKTSKQVSLE